MKSPWAAKKLNIMYVYIMMNKPKGVISSTDGSKRGGNRALISCRRSFGAPRLFPQAGLIRHNGFMLITDEANLPKYF
jgi:16S rRNA U516 pseudouridylate synthase RsuA-like enzyme